MEKMLNVFIEKNINHNGFQEYLIKSFSPTLKNYYSKYSIETYKKLVKKEAEQQTLHTFMEQDCNDLFAFCKQNNIPIIGLKGIFIEKQFWNQMRFYNDIDVMISKEDIKKLYGYFAEKGTYRVVKKRSLNPIQRQPRLSSILNVDLEKTHHIVLWNENDELRFNGVNHIEIEIHGAFDTFKIVDFNEECIFNDRLAFENYFVLNSESQILFLIYHAIQHLPYIRHNLRELFVKFDRFIDVAKVILKSNIDWDKFITLCKIHSMSPLCSFYFKMFKEIFPNLVPDTILLQIDLLANQSDFYWKKIYLKLMTMNSVDLIIGNFKDFQEIEVPFNNIKKYILRNHFRNPYILKIAMEIWKYKLNKINSKL